YVRVINPEPVARPMQRDVAGSGAVVFRVPQFAAGKWIRPVSKVFQSIARTVEQSALGHGIPPAVPLENAPVKNSENLVCGFEVETVRRHGDKGFLSGGSFGGSMEIESNLLALLVHLHIGRSDVS